MHMHAQQIVTLSNNTMTHQIFPFYRVKYLLIDNFTYCKICVQGMTILLFFWITVTTAI